MIICPSLEVYERCFRSVDGSIEKNLRLFSSAYLLYLSNQQIIFSCYRIQLAVEHLKARVWILSTVYIYNYRNSKNTKMEKNHLANPRLKWTWTSLAAFAIDVLTRSIELSWTIFAPSYAFSSKASQLCCFSFQCCSVSFQLGTATRLCQASDEQSLCVTERMICSCRFLKIIRKEIQFQIEFRWCP